MGISKLITKLKAKPTLPDHQVLVGKYHDGNVVCEYVLRNDEKVFDGPFQYEYKYGSMFSDKGSETAKGTFSMNRKQGQWKMEIHTPHHDKELLVMFVNGRVEGEVEYRCTERDYLGRVSNTALSFVVHDGHVVGEIRGMLGGKKFAGYCDEEGRPEGQWMVDTNKGDASIKHTDFEMWSHGKLLSSYSKMKEKKTQQDLRPYMRRTFSDLINGEVMDLLFVVRRGTHTTRFEIPYEPDDSEQ